LLWAAFGGGFLIVLLSTFMTDHFDLFGLRQVYLRFLETPYRNPDFKVIWFYRFVRHPLYTGMFFALWATPHMTLGHLLFAGALTIYVVIAVRFEERDLVAMLGEEYRDYQQRVPMFAPMPGKTSETIRTHDPAPSGMR
jgi:steroid 5-alpha reductase family enzyme